MDIYLYLGLLVFFMFLVFETILLTFKYCPIKIKEVLGVTLALVVFRTASMMGLLLSDQVGIVYIVRNLMFLNIVYMPMIIFICIYIFYRNIKMNIKWIWGILIATLAMYLVCIFLIPMEYYISLSYGYNVSFHNMIPYKLFLCVYGVVFIVGMQAVKFKYSVKWGMILVEIASVVSIVTTAMAIRSTENIGWLLIGEIAFMIVLYLAVRTFKKTAAK